MLYEPTNYNTFAYKLRTEQRPVQCTLYAESQTNQCLKGLKHIVRGQKRDCLLLLLFSFGNANTTCLVGDYKPKIKMFERRCIEKEH